MVAHGQKSERLCEQIARFQQRTVELVDEPVSRVMKEIVEVERLIPQRTVEQIEAPLVKVVHQERIWRGEKAVHKSSSKFLMSPSSQAWTNISKELWSRCLMFFLVLVSQSFGHVLRCPRSHAHEVPRSRVRTSKAVYKLSNTFCVTKFGPRPKFATRCGTVSWCPFRAWSHKLSRAF